MIEGWSVVALALGYVSVLFALAWYADRVGQFTRSSTGGMTNAPAMTPITSAHCCFHGVALTNCPVLRSSIFRRVASGISLTTRRMPR